MMLSFMVTYQLATLNINASKKQVLSIFILKNPYLSIDLCLILVWAALTHDFKKDEN